MAWKTAADSDSAESQHKVEYERDERAQPNLENIDEEPKEVKLERALKARHITMIGRSQAVFDMFRLDSFIDVSFPLAIGGAIGTGLIIGTGDGLAA